MSFLKQNDFFGACYAGYFQPNFNLLYLLLLFITPHGFDVLFLLLGNLGGGGGDRGVTISRFPYPVLPPPVRFCPFVSRLPPFIVFLPLSCKSRCLTPYSDSKIGSALALSKIKNCVVNRTTPHFPARSLKRHSFDTSLHHAAKSSLQFPC